MDRLHKKICAEMEQRGGVLPFWRFMELALYAPSMGYYERSLAQTGRAGDFMTNVSVGRLFGEMLAARWVRWARELAGRLQLVEAGAHAGDFAADVLGAVAQHAPDVRERMEYWILEPSRERRKYQRNRLLEFGEMVKWFEEWSALPGQIRGLVFSNELLDALPVHRISWNALRKEWFEWGVEAAGNGFRWRALAKADLKPEQMPQVPKALTELLPDGFTTEINSRAVDWWEAAAERLAAGRLMTIDYGLETLDFFRPERSKGTLRGFARHHGTVDILQNPGEQDLTAHINFETIRDAGERQGLKTEAELPQTRFLMEILAQEFSERAMAWTAVERRQFQTLTHPEHLGRSFRVLVQRRE